MKLYINKSKTPLGNQVYLVLATSKKQAQESISTIRDDYKSMWFDILDKKPNVNDFTEVSGWTLPIDETEFVQVYGVSNLPR
jgi:hypothetical protein